MAGNRQLVNRVVCMMRGTQDGGSSRSVGCVRVGRARGVLVTRCGWGTCTWYPWGEGALSFPNRVQGGAAGSGGAERLTGEIPRTGRLQWSIYAHPSAPPLPPPVPLLSYSPFSPRWSPPLSLPTASRRVSQGGNKLKICILRTVGS